MHTSHLHRVALACVLAFITSAASAQTAAKSPSASASASTATKDGKLVRSDESFLKQAAQNGHTEVEGSKLALTKATNPKVKEFAQKMVDDHTKMHHDVEALATAKGVELPTQPSIAQRAAIKLLSTADGANFDKRYADIVGVKAHNDTVKMFEKASKDAKDPEVKALATKALPQLKEHQAMAKSLQSATKAEGK
jgi:putative membrane protein